jgi:ArsR family transcriptional regulator
MSETECAILAEFFTTFGNPTRLRMFCALQDGQKTVSQLAEAAGVSLQNASQHLRLMRDKGVVVTHREGQFVYYAIIDERFVQGARMMREALLEAMVRKLGRTTATASDL